HHDRLRPDDGGATEHLLEIVLGMEAVAPYAGAARAVVLDAIAGEHLDPSIIHADRNLDLHFAEGGHEDLPHVRFEIDEVGGPVELALDDGSPGHGRSSGTGRGRGGRRGGGGRLYSGCQTRVDGWTGE